jgi:hydroxylamine dehydrogenase
MCGQCHNVENRCDSCHFRHRFSPSEARDPMACATCHMGPDHPHIEMYQHSKHGSRFEVYGDTETVPVCVDCHMPYNDQMLGKRKGADGTTYTDHNLATGIAYGPVGDGTTRNGLTMDLETGRVRFIARDSDAEYEELWLERNDGMVYDASLGGSVVFNGLYELSVADVSGNGKQDYVVHQPEDSEETLLANRQFMAEQVCAQCHTRNLAQEQLLIADLIHENTRNTLLEAFDIVKALAMTGVGSLTTDHRPGNPETGTTGTYGANMKIRNLTAVEKMYFTAMKYENVKTWKGAYHQNPDYTHWYGWSALVMTLGEIADEATDKVLQHLWVRGQDYPGATGDVFDDGLYQGVIFDTASMTNLYDKFPGPSDENASEFIDVDMDGIPEFVPVEGSPGTFTHDSTEVTFH